MERLAHFLSRRSRPSHGRQTNILNQRMAFFERCPFTVLKWPRTSKLFSETCLMSFDETSFLARTTSVSPFVALLKFLHVQFPRTSCQSLWGCCSRKSERQMFSSFLMPYQNNLLCASLLLFIDCGIKLSCEEDECSVSVFVPSVSSSKKPARSAFELPLWGA